MKSPTALSDALNLSVSRHLAELSAVEEDTAAYKPRTDKWSRKEILGHLIDSAANNHHRFVLMRQKDDMVFESYDQELWVNAHEYQERDWHSLLRLWTSYNHHLSLLVRHIPADLLNRPFTRHNLDRVAFNVIPMDQSATIAYLVEDYIAHMEHHLAQITDYPY